MTFDVLDKVIPSTIIDAFEPAIFCLDELVVVLSIDANPEPEGLSVAVILRAFSLPVADFNTRLKVPSPAPTILADTLKLRALILSLNDARVSVEVTVNDLELTDVLATKLLEDQSPLSKISVPPPTIASEDV